MTGRKEVTRIAPWKGVSRAVHRKEPLGRHSTLGPWQERQRSERTLQPRTTEAASSTWQSGYLGSEGYSPFPALSGHWISGALDSHQ